MGDSVSPQTIPADITTGSTWKNIWHMSWPMLLVMFFNFLVGMTDIYVAGLLGPEIQAIAGFAEKLDMVSTKLVRLHITTAVPG